MTTSDQLKSKYDSQYSRESAEWRLIGGKKKAENIVNIAKDDNTNKVLDVGSGDGSVLYWLEQMNFSNDITSVEISQSGVNEIKSKNLSSLKEVHLFDGYELPFENDSFDLVICSHVVEHVEFPRKLIREIKRVSKKQIFEIPIDFSWTVDTKLKHFLSYGHINIFTPQTFRFLLKSEGLKIESYTNKLYSAEVHRRINKSKKYTERFKNNIKRIIWNLWPPLMRKRPNTTTVKTSKTSTKLEIMNDSI